MEKSKVYFTKEISPCSLIKMYDVLGKNLSGNVAVKISTGERGNNNYLNPNLIKDLVSYVSGTITECNTAYAGYRNSTSVHMETIREHGFLDIAEVDIMDSDGDFAIPVSNGFHLDKNYVGNHLKNYDSMLMLSHFKGHPMGGFGGALKNMSIGVASSSGKVYIHTAGKSRNVDALWENICSQDSFLESMADADSSVVNYMNGNIVYINVINNLSVDYDCVASPEDICMHDIGVLSSTDPVALDRACVDLIYNSSDFGKVHMIERIERQNGTYILEAASKLGIGSWDYDFINMD